MKRINPNIRDSLFKGSKWMKLNVQQWLGLSLKAVPVLTEQINDQVEEQVINPANADEEE